MPRAAFSRYGGKFAMLPALPPVRASTARGGGNRANADCCRGMRSRCWSHFPPAV